MSSLTIRLTESVIFLKTGNPQCNPQPSVLRGLLTLELVKPTKISGIEVELQGTSFTMWTDRGFYDNVIPLDRRESQSTIQALPHIAMR